jgi:DNA-binding transcriptional MerR regulator
MKFSDIITLAKAGYTPKDVKELLELTETDPAVKNKEIPKDESKDDSDNKEDSEDKDVKDAFEKLVERNK